jgi:2-oxoglutarate dehydrogenase E1 component
MKPEMMQGWWQSSYLSDGSSAYLEDLYERYLEDPQGVPAEWRQCFENLPKKNGHQEASHAAVRDYFRHLARNNKVVGVAAATPTANVDVTKAVAVAKLVDAYRALGHFQATLDPLNLAPRHNPLQLSLTFHGLSESDLAREFQVSGFTDKPTKLQDIVARLRQQYCGNIGYEYAYIANHDQQLWLQQRIENKTGNLNFDANAKKRFLRLLTAAEGLERYLGNKYVGQKRFSLEGADSMIPMIDELIQRAGSSGVKEMVIGMAHRGRLNVLINLLGKSPSDLFSEFEGKYHDTIYSGDVKYHKGFSSDIETAGGPVHLALAFNPSHLEVINPVVAGSVRARQERRHVNGQARKEVVPILIHGDAAVAGQGVVMETLNMSQTRGFGVGGSIHIVVNNQIGFTISNPQDARSTPYCTDIAKMVDAPVFHVNGDDVEAVIAVTQLALDYRMTFQRDVFIDLVCYRRHGHNEADEPAATQPVMYHVIRNHATPPKIYAEQLIQEQVIAASDAEKMVDDYRLMLDHGQPIIKMVRNPVNAFAVDWSPYINQQWDMAVATKVSLKKLKELGEKLTRIPEGFELQPQVKREMDFRVQMMEGKIPFHWGYGETLAYATLLDQGIPVRLCGQDAGRGTFSHRHSVLHDLQNDKVFIPLANLQDKQAGFEVIDSMLSEEAVMGFEYGYAASAPNELVLWEGQFGDFANGAQVIIDQFLSSGEQKWGRLCGLVLLLPHGYEGMGPEHSSARLERYLQLAAQQNMQICEPSTPAQMFHLLRRQMLRPLRTPLIVMTPKSLLRHKLAVSTLDELAEGKFQVVLPEIDDIAADQVRRVIFCRGRVYYDLLENRRSKKQTDIAILRVEQLYPFPEKAIKEQLALYSKAKDIVWCQDEPKNQGAWDYIQPLLLEVLSKSQRLNYVGRLRAAAPAVGSAKVHQKQQATLIEQALTT